MGKKKWLLEFKNNRIRTHTSLSRLGGFSEIDLCSWTTLSPFQDKEILLKLLEVKGQLNCFHPSEMRRPFMVVESTWKRGS